jgi:hypothetical protein
MQPRKIVVKEEEKKKEEKKKKKGERMRSIKKQKEMPTAGIEPTTFACHSDRPEGANLQVQRYTT